MNSEHSLIGTVIGNYQIIAKLGEGGMGTVYLGQHTLLGRRAAIKVLLTDLSARADIVNRFFNEARAVTSISDPGIVQVFDFGYHVDGSAFIVMEYLEGEPLDRRLARLGKLPAAEALRLCRQIASSLAAAHAQNIIHRDLKPENIYLVHDGEVASGERSKILDFGIAKLSDDNPGKIKTNTGALMGTPIYMSPEQCRGLAELDHRSDIYSLGCVLFHLLTGRPPFEGEGMGDIIAAHIKELAPAPSSRAPEVSPAVDQLVLRCLAKAPAERFQTMLELATAIGQILPYITSPVAPTQWVYAYQGGAGPTPTPPPGQPYPSRPPHASQPQYPPQAPQASQPPYPPQAAHASHASQPPYPPGTPVPQAPYASRPGTPPPPPPGMPAHSYPAGAAGPNGPTVAAAPPVQAVVTAVRPTPTTLGASNGQVATRMPGAGGRSKLGWVLAAIVVLGGAGAAIAVVSSRGDDRAAATTHDAGVLAMPAVPDAAQVPAISPPPPATPIDAGVPDTSLPDAPPPIIPAPPVDAAPPPIDAPGKRPPHRPHNTPQRPGSGAGSGTGVTTPPGCDRSVDTDCDGIPDVR
jgi:serine/threonine protein kinase